MPASSISRQDAKLMILRYQNDPSSGTIKGGLIPADMVKSVLNQPGCVALRFYFARNDKGENTIVLVGETAAKISMSDDLLVDNIPPCPPICPDGNPLDG